MPSTAGSNVIQYGTGNFVAINDFGWVWGTYNGSRYGADGIRIRPRHDAVITDLRRGGSAGAKEHALRRRDAARIADDQAAHVSDAAYAVDRAKRIACFAGQRYRWRGASL